MFYITSLWICFIFNFCYFLYRNHWVHKRRIELVKWYFNIKNPVYSSYEDFDDKFGTYDNWLYSRPFCWNPAILAKLDKWIL